MNLYPHFCVQDRTVVISGCDALPCCNCVAFEFSVVSDL